MYEVKKFRHYLLANNFTLFVDHQALLYLVIKPYGIGKILRWFLILFEFDFGVVVKKGTIHQRVEHLSQINLGESPNGVPDDLLDATLSQIEWIPQWSENLCELLATGSLDHVTMSKQKKDLIYQSASFQIIAGRLYNFLSQGILHLCESQKLLLYSSLYRYWYGWITLLRIENG